MSDPTTPSCCSVVELRQYTMQPGKRDVLIEMFEREFIETQEDAGMHVIGHFRDLDRPDMFVWLRGFDDMESRRDALDAFYGGPTWLAHRDAANATLIDSDDVLLLRPSGPSSMLPHPGARRPSPTEAHGGPASDAVFELTLYSIPTAGDVDRDELAAFATMFESDAAVLLDELGMRPIAWYVTEAADNSYPRLPVRGGERVLVSIIRFDDLAAHAEGCRRRSADRRWTAVEAQLATTSSAVQIMRLSPTSRSQLQ